MQLLSPSGIIFTDDEHVYVRKHWILEIKHVEFKTVGYSAVKSDVLLVCIN